VVLTALPLWAGESTELPALTSDQVARVRELVRRTQTQASLIQSRIEQRQRELAQVYAEYELKSESAEKLQQEIVDLQRRLLANHHAMQMQLRSIVGKARFEVLRRRLEAMVGQSVAPEASKTASSPKARP